MGGNLELDSCPNLIAVYEGKAGLAAVRPAAQEQTALVAEGKSGSLGICYVKEILFQIV